jgi:hypothetical protein
VKTISLVSCGTDSAPSKARPMPATTSPTVYGSRRRRATMATMAATSSRTSRRSALRAIWVSLSRPYLPHPASAHWGELPRVAVPTPMPGPARFPPRGRRLAT